MRGKRSDVLLQKKPGQNCGSGNRAAAMWFIKRVLIDKWDNDRASEEAAQLGLGNQALKTFALDYIQAHKKSVEP